MKTSFLIACVFFYTIQLVDGQTIDLDKAESTGALRESYLQKYKTNNTIGWVFLCSGIGMIVGGGVVFANYAGQGFNGPAPVTEEVLFLIVGPAAALTSIPFFIFAKRNKRKANLLIKEESVSFGNKVPFKSNYAALALTINF